MKGMTGLGKACAVCSWLKQLMGNKDILTSWLGLIQTLFSFISTR